MRATPLATRARGPDNARVRCFAFLAIAACASSPPPEPANAPAPANDPIDLGGGTAEPRAGPATAPAHQQRRPYQPPPGDAPEISRSLGEKGGVVLLWPRVVPRSATDALRPVAAEVQARLRRIVARALPGRPIDQRPEPERACPRAGCDAMTVWAVVTGKPEGCAVVLLTANPGSSPTWIKPWGGRVELRNLSVPFRDPPESQVIVRDFADCRTPAFLDAGEAVVEQTIRESAPPER